jgi:large subunit ribosomal protein L28e
MVAVPDQLVWEIVRKNHSFLKIKNGRTKRSGRVKFSSEKGNIKALNMFKYSAIANSQAVDVQCNKADNHRTQLVRKAASKAGTKSSMIVSNINKDFRRAVPHILKQSADVYYRPDLKDALLAKYTKVYQANRRAKGITKPALTKKGRGTLGKETATAEE